MGKQKDEVLERTTGAYVERYNKAMHAMQTGVALKMNRGNLNETCETDAKHLRVGINGAFIDSAALAKLLIEKNVISENEYFKALAEQAEFEAESYEVELGLEKGTLR